jgi:protein-disulfide isomerase/uncharacterized protein YqeY
MALRDLINAALNVAANDRRRATLSEALTEAGGETAGDAEILAALAKLIAAREQKAGSLTLAGQTALAAQEHEEINALRDLLRQAAPNEPQPKTKTKIPATAPVVAASQSETGKSPFTHRQIWIAAGVAGLLLAAGLAWYLIGSGTDRSGSGLETASPQQLTIYKDDRTLGSPKAPVTILEYAAPACPHCAHFNETVMPLLKSTYIDTGKVYYIFRVFPIMPADAAVESIARSCLPADKYFQFIDLMFRNQDKWDPENGVTDVRGGLIQMTRIVGLNAQQVDQCISDPKAQEHINRIAEEGAKKYDLHGVPAFIVNGTLWRAGGATWPELQQKIDSLLPKK